MYYPEEKDSRSKLAFRCSKIINQSRKQLVGIIDCRKVVPSQIFWVQNRVSGKKNVTLIVAKWPRGGAVERKRARDSKANSLHPHCVTSMV